MFQFDLSKVPSDIAQLLMTHGAGTRPLQWAEQQNPLAKKILDDDDNVVFFETLPLKSEEMAWAAKALLVLWGGWPKEAVTLARSAGLAEKLYIASLCERQLGHADRAKQLLQGVGVHPIYQPLMQHAMKTIRPGADASIKRFRDLLEFNEEWEPYAFIDFYEQARVGTISPVARELISNMQTKEFELLFAYCYEAATGKSLAKRRLLSEEEEKRREEEHRRWLAERRMTSQRTMKTNSKSSTPKKKTEKPPAETKAKILCPRCETMMFVPEEARGKKVKCLHCDAVFLVPTKKQTVVRQFASKK